MSSMYLSDESCGCIIWFEMKDSVRLSFEIFVSKISICRQYMVAIMVSYLVTSWIHIYLSLIIFMVYGPSYVLFPSRYTLAFCLFGDETELCN